MNKANDTMGDPFSVAKEDGGAAMVFLGGSKESFRCDVPQGRGKICGCNVFTRVGAKGYRCNSCRMLYEAC